MNQFQWEEGGGGGGMNMESKTKQERLENSMNHNFN